MPGNNKTYPRRKGHILEVDGMPNNFVTVIAVSDMDQHLILDIPPTQWMLDHQILNSTSSGLVTFKFSDMKQ